MFVTSRLQLRPQGEEGSSTHNLMHHLSKKEPRKHGLCQKWLSIQPIQPQSDILTARCALQIHINLNTLQTLMLGISRAPLTKMGLFETLHVNDIGKFSQEYYAEICLQICL